MIESHREAEGSRISNRVEISYDVPGFEPTAVSQGKTLAVELDAVRSPLLFGCRTGLCGTCLVEVVDGAAHLAPPTDDEKEILEAYTSNPHARLACQLEVSAPLRLKPITG